MFLYLHVFHISPDAQLTLCDDRKVNTTLVEELASEREDRFHWVNIEADERDSPEFQELIDRLRLGTIISSPFRRPPDDWMSQIVSTKTKAFVMIRILPALDVNGRYIGTEFEYIAAMLKNRILSPT